MAKEPPPNITFWWDHYRDWHPTWSLDLARQLSDLVGSKDFQIDLRCAEGRNKAAATRLRKKLATVAKLAKAAREQALNEVIHHGKPPEKKPKPVPKAPEVEPEELLSSGKGRFLNLKPDEPDEPDEPPPAATKPKRPRR